MTLFKYLLTAFALAVLLSTWMVYHHDQIAKEAAPLIYSDIHTVPHKKAALLLGTAKYVAKGRINYYYKYRIDAAVKLFKAGKVQAIVVSGDNGDHSYDEPTTMKNDLIAQGIPERYITLDYAGFRTLDSLVRAKAIFDLDDYIIISQKFHLERAIYLANEKGYHVIGFEAKSLQETLTAKRMKLREILARAKAFLDVHLLATEPKFYGDKVEVQYR